jgi:DinB family protein
MQIQRPAANEYNEFYQKYIDLVKQTDLLTALADNRDAIVHLIQSIPAAIEVFRYDTNKWSIKEVLMHITDFERYIAFKAFVSLRNDVDTVIYHPNREHYLYHSHTETRSLADLLPEFLSVRAATLSLFRHANISQLLHTGNHANTAHAVSSRALGFAIVGHTIHHMRVIREKYLRLSQAGTNN